MFVISYSVTFCVYIPGNREFVFIIIVKFMMTAYSRIRFGLKIANVYLYITWSHYHNFANLSEDIELIDVSQIYFAERVCEQDKAYSLSYPLYYICGVVCFQFAHFPCDHWENIYTLSYYHHQIGRMNYYPLFRVTSWNNGMRCMSFYILMNLWYDRIASWGIRVLVVFAPNLALCHWYAALLPC